MIAVDLDSGHQMTFRMEFVWNKDLRPTILSFVEGASSYGKGVVLLFVCSLLLFLGE